MNYEKKYNEALERAKKLHDSYNLMHISVDEIEQIFPELAESEDERIRKWLIMMVNNFSAPNFNEFDRKDVLAWLEKQKENIEKEYVFRPLAGTDITIAAEQAIRRANEGDRLVLAFNGAYIPVRKGCDANKIVDIYDTFMEKQKEQEHICDSAQYEEGFKTGLEIGLRKQKPAEWSEEDEKIIDWAIETLEHEHYLILAEKLKSLKPQTHWKPSEDELAKKHLDGYCMGREDTMREMKDFIESHFNTNKAREGEDLADLYRKEYAQPLCLRNGGVCTNPMRDCINCIPTLERFNTSSGTSTLKAEG